MSNLTVCTWNIEGLKNNYFTLYTFVKRFLPKLIFLSEPQVYQCDIGPLIKPFIGSYSAHLNSEDVHDLELPLTHPKAKGGTMVLWDNSISPHLKVLDTTSPYHREILMPVLKMK